MRKERKEKKKKKRQREKKRKKRRENKKKVNGFGSLKCLLNLTMYPWQVFKLSVFPPRPSFSSSSLQSQIPRTHSPVSRLQLLTAKEIASVSPSTIIGNYTARACRDAIHLKVNIMFMTRRRPRESKLSARSPAGPVCWHWLDRLSLLLSSVTHA